MGNKTAISWCDATWNPIRGCSRVSAGCGDSHGGGCYAERQAARFSGKGAPYEGLIRITAKGPRWNGVVRMVPKHLADPMRWKKPRRIFVNSMSDLFHEGLTNAQIAAVFGVMSVCSHHVFQVLTKRGKRMRDWFAWLDGRAAELRCDPDETIEEARADFLIQCAADELGDGSEGDNEKWHQKLSDMQRDAWAYDKPDEGTVFWERPWPLPHVWLGVSVENQAAADERIPELLATPAAVRFLSCEPLLGPLDLRGRDRSNSWSGGDWLRSYRHQRDHDDGTVEVLEDRPQRIDWVISGCESGPGSRACDVEWLRSLRDQCVPAGVPFFLKQAKQQDGAYTITDARPIPKVVGRVGELIPIIGLGDGSNEKGGGLVELPYLDGQQWAQFPEVTGAA